MSPRAWLVCGLLVFASCGAANTALAQTKLSVAKVANDFALMMADYGNKLGNFQKRGLEVKVTLITQAKMIQALIGGSIDMALASGATLAYIPKGAPLKGVAALSGPPSIMVLIVRPDSPIKSIAQLRGRTVAISNLGSLTDWAVSQIAVHENWPTSDIKRVSVGNTPARVAALKTGEADGAVIDIASALNLEERGDARILVNFGDLVTHFQNQIVYASDDIIQHDPDAVRKFVAGIFETIDYARAHKAETVAFTTHELGIQPSVARRVYDALMNTNFFSRDGRFDLATLKAMSKSFVEMKLLRQPRDLSQYVTERFLPNKQ